MYVDEHLNVEATSLEHSFMNIVWYIRMEHRLTVS